jgi:ABC-type phosphate/phosphonate transport system substrate-binding protein
MSATASLPMYDLPELRRATDSWWQGLATAFRREGLEDVPAQLTRASCAEDLWQDSALLFSQTCGYPLATVLEGRVQVVATPRYACRGCDGGPFYRSFILVPQDHPAQSLAELAGARAVYNARNSHSGYNVLRFLLAPFARGGRFLGAAFESGTHRASLAWLRARRADFCAIDCVTHALIERHAPAELEGLRVLAKSPRAPALPFVTSGLRAAEDLARLRAGLRAALENPNLAEAREALLLKGADVLPTDAYKTIPDMERKALALNFGALT